MIFSLSFLDENVINAASVAKPKPGKNNKISANAKVSFGILQDSIAVFNI